MTGLARLERDAAPRTFPLPGGYRLAVRPFPWGETGREIEWRVMRLEEPGVSLASGEAYDLEDARRRAVNAIERPRAERRRLVSGRGADRDPTAYDLDTPHDAEVFYFRLRELRFPARRTGTRVESDAPEWAVESARKMVEAYGSSRSRDRRDPARGTRGLDYFYATEEIKRSPSYQLADRLERQIAPDAWRTTSLTPADFDRLIHVWDEAGFHGWAENYRAEAEERFGGPGRRARDYDSGRDRLTTAARRAIPDRLFALPERRALPIHDASHVRNAAARLEQMRTLFHSVTPAEYSRAKRAILAREADLGIGPFNPRYAHRYGVQAGRVTVEPRERAGERGRERERVAADPQRPSREQSAFIHQKVPILIDEGYPQRQAVAIAYHMAGVPPRPGDVARRRGRGRRDAATGPHARQRPGWELEEAEYLGYAIGASRRQNLMEDVAENARELRNLLATVERTRGPAARAHAQRAAEAKVREAMGAGGDRARDVDLPFALSMAALGGVSVGLIGSAIAYERRTARKAARDPWRGEIEALRSEAERQGWRVERTGSGHWRFVPPDPSRRIVITSATPSDKQAIHRMRADLKKSGLALEARDPLRRTDRGYVMDRRETEQWNRESYEADQFRANMMTDLTRTAAAEGASFGLWGAGGELYEWFGEEPPPPVTQRPPPPQSPPPGLATRSRSRQRDHRPNGCGCGDGSCKGRDPAEAAKMSYAELPRVVKDYLLERSRGASKKVLRSIWQLMSSRQRDETARFLERYGEGRPRFNPEDWQP